MIIDYLSMSLVELALCQVLIFAEKQKFVKALTLNNRGLTKVVHYF